MSVAKDLAEGRLTADQLQSYAATSCHELLSTVVGPSDALWDVQLGICRGVLAARGLSVDELTEWLAVARRGAVQPDANGDTNTVQPIHTPRTPMQSDLVSVCAALFGVDECGPLELEATCAALARHRIAVADAARWFGEGDRW